MILRVVSHRSFSQINRTMSSNTKALVVGIYAKSKGDEKKNEQVKLTPFAQKINEKSNGKLLTAINTAFCDSLSNGKTRIIYGQDIEGYKAIAVTALDPKKWDEHDQINGVNESVRIAASAAVKSLQALKVKEVYLDDLGNATAAAEGALLANFKFQPYKAKKVEFPAIHAAGEVTDAWKKGVVYGNAQNFCKTLMDTPANYMTPTIFCDTVKAKYEGLANVELVAHDEAWAKKEKMGLYLSVSAGSSEPPKFLEITYNGDPSSKKPIALVGKGITFDSGGISLKSGSKMDQMRADMGGAANVASAIWALAQLKVKVNVKGFIPLCENMPGNNATKPGDVITGRSGKTVCVDNTDAEGRLVLADALSYACDFNPLWILDIATLTGAVRVALGDCVSAIYSTSDDLWQSIHQAGQETGDRVWRMPLFSHYTSQMTEHDAYDLNNLGKGKGAGSCTAAAFLREFVPKDAKWLHADIAGVMTETSDQTYIGSGMTGRPVRTLIEFVERESKK